MSHYLVKLHATPDGKASFCDVDFFDGRRWRSVGRTRAMRTFPQASRARNEGAAIAKRHRAEHNPSADIVHE